MTRKIHVYRREQRPESLICETCQTALEDGEFYRASNAKVYHVNKDRCNINRRTKGMTRGVI